jgi:predicted metalloprotease
MRLDDQSASQNVEDRRGAGGGVGRGSVGVGTLVIALVAGYFFGIDPAVILGLVSSGSARAVGHAGSRSPRPATKWRPSSPRSSAAPRRPGMTVFAEAGRRYQEPKLVLFTGATPTACGTGQVGHGPLLLPGRSEGLHRPGLLP